MLSICHLTLNWLLEIINFLILFTPLSLRGQRRSKTLARAWVCCKLKWLSHCVIISTVKTSYEAIHIEHRLVCMFLCYYRFAQVPTYVVVWRGQYWFCEKVSCPMDAWLLKLRWSNCCTFWGINGAITILEDQPIIKLFVNDSIVAEEVAQSLRHFKFLLRGRLIGQLKALFISEIMHFAKLVLSSINCILNFQIFPILSSIISFNQLLRKLVWDYCLWIPLELFQNLTLEL